eukprot:GAHX01001845.1.p1 GENE.GAHX01001845.1~~GAHX01001845.1.p1  ORF type:complete len:520 (+),score=132.71 GAHX01001845.1:23-1582(+)
MKNVPLIDGADGLLSYIHDLRSTLGLSDYDLELYKTNLKDNAKFLREKLNLKTFVVKDEIEKHKNSTNLLTVVSLVVTLSEIRFSDSVINLKNDLAANKKRTKSSRKNKKSISFLTSLKAVISNSQIDVQVGLNNVLQLLENKKYSEADLLLNTLSEKLTAEKPKIKTMGFLYYTNLIKENRLRLSNQTMQSETDSENKALNNFKNSHTELQINLKLLNERLKNRQSVNNETLFINNHISSLLEILEPMLYDKKTKLEADSKMRLSKEINFLKFLRLANMNLETSIKLKNEFEKLYEKVQQKKELKLNELFEIVDMSNKLFNNTKDNYLDVDLSTYIREKETYAEDLNTSFVGDRNSYHSLVEAVFGEGNTENEEKEGKGQVANIGSLFGITKSKALRNYVEESILACNFYKEVANALVLLKKQSFKEAVSETNMLLEEEAFDEERKDTIKTIKRYILGIFCKEKTMENDVNQPVVFNQPLNRYRKKLKLTIQREPIKKDKEGQSKTEPQEQKKWYKFW